jgi:hypothetical protein
MKQNRSENAPSPDSRRQFLRQGMVGAALFGLGSALGLLAPASTAQTPPKKTSSSKLGTAYTYDVESLRKVDPQLMLYQESTPLDPGLKEIRALQCASDGRLLAAGDRSVVTLNAQGTRASEIRLETAPRCLAIGDNGKLFVGLKNRVLVCANGSVETRWDEIKGKTVLTAIAIAEKAVFVADAGNRAVWKYDLDGKLTGRVGLKEGSTTASRFIVPSPYFDLKIGAGAKLWVVNPGQHRLEAFSFDGELMESWGETSLQIAGFCGCCNPVYFAILPNGGFVTSEKGLTRVKIYSAKGEFEGVVAGPEQFPQYAVNADSTATGLAVAADAQGRVFVADSLTHQVRVFVRKPKA